MTNKVISDLTGRISFLEGKVNALEVILQILYERLSNKEELKVVK
jgi:hypothetical protein